ncbi:ImcF-related family protein [Roseivivax isoporae]|uniref:IcmF-related protein n=1 Tax=Roseivivax isoporae LMG 25204 TaxID=1449351 RepID=X7F1X3_9RHOB|nr:ImcF-related family protein [Roseivivax isoporae]ETX26753.1 hypothetical protein RISW2_19400 [Roseivivax isoporae LMG 25204]
MARPREEPSSLDRAAAPILRFIEDLPRRARHEGAKRLATEAGGLLARFESDAGRGGAHPHTLKPARYALAVLIDQTARQARGLSLSAWNAVAAGQLFEGREMTLARIREFRATARGQGEAFAPLAAFLDAMLARIGEVRAGPRRLSGGGWLPRAAGFVLLVLGALGGYAGWLEWRYHAPMIAEFDAEALVIGLDRPQQGAELVRRLDALQAARDRVVQAGARAPFRGIVRLPAGNSAAHAGAAYDAAVARHVPGAVADAIETVLATEGEGLVLYDALRAWAVLTGRVDWQPGYLAGWLRDNEGRIATGGLARHLGPLAGASTDIVATDTVVMDQARAFAAETPEPARAWLELLRSDEMRALPDWTPATAVPDIPRVVLRRSGRPVEEGLPGLFTARGWTEAREIGVGLAVQRARALDRQITGQDLAPENSTPDLLMDRLHAETIAAWKAWLADLRVRPFAERETAIVVSGLLAQAENPLSALLREVWNQAGGNDRRRSHDQQLALAREFGPMIQYVEAGRMAEIAQLFSALNVALGALDIDAGRGARRLMSIQDRARSVAALQSAPRIVVQIAEDVLAQTAQPQAIETASNPLARHWQTEVFPLCRDALAARYPFSEGRDADPVQIAALLGPQGALNQFLQSSALPFLETDESPWRWKPEARFAGLSPESAAFLERAAQASEGLFGPGGMDHTLRLAALAERGQTMVSIGGQSVPVRASGVPAVLTWPGTAPDAGIEVAFRESADAARIAHRGPWGLYRLLDGLRLRLRDDGARVLLDLRNEAGRVFLEVGFDAALNPVSVRPALQGLACPPAL